VAINVAQLEQQLQNMSANDAPGREFCDAIAELARTGRFARLRDVLPGVVYKELLARYKADPTGFISDWRQLAQDMRQGFIQHARERLTSLTRLQDNREASRTPAWQAIQRALDNREMTSFESHLDLSFFR
jgi:predicted hotdog family 3-hydroxylacyl-ACP dehydratase